MTNLEFNLNNEEESRQNNKKQATLYRFPQSEKRSPLDSKMQPMLFADVWEDKNPAVAKFLFYINDKEKEFVSYNKSECEKYKKLLEDRKTNTPNIEPRWIWGVELGEFKRALQNWPEENK